MAELPEVGGDDGTWGGILNEFLGVSLDPDGTLNAEAVQTAIGPSGVTPGTYGDAEHFVQVTVSDEGFITEAVDIPLSGGPPSGAAGGSLAGTYPNPTIKSSAPLPGSPTTTTQAALDNSTKVATTGYADAAVGVETTRAETQEALLAPKASPALTGVPTAPTASGGTNTTQLATTAFVEAALPTGLPPTGSAGGDLSGTYPNPTVAKVNGSAISTTQGSLLSTIGQTVLIAGTGPFTLLVGTSLYGGSSSPVTTLPTAPVNGSVVTLINAGTGTMALGAGGGDTIVGGSLSVLPGYVASVQYLTAGTEWFVTSFGLLASKLLPLTGGTLSGPLAMGASKITGLANGTVSTDAAAFGQIPTALPPNGTAGGDLSGTYPNPTVAKINGVSLGGLATGILKNTTTTGVPSIATAGTDYPATGVIAAGGPTGGTATIPVITYNANGQLTAVTTATVNDTTKISLSTVTTAGDIIYATGSGAVTRLGIGAAGTVLGGGASAPAWVVVPGTLLATHQYAPASLVSYPLTTAITAIDTTNLTLSFTVPANGIVDVDVTMEGQVVTNVTTGNVIGMALFQHGGSTQLGQTVNPVGCSAVTVQNPLGTIRARFHLTGLTPGALQVDVAASCSSTGSGVTGSLFAQGYTGSASASKSSPALMQAFASL